MRKAFQQEEGPCAGVLFVLSVKLSNKSVKNKMYFNTTYGTIKKTRYKSVYNLGNKFHAYQKK